MREFLWGIFTAILGTAGFALLFRIELKRLPWAILGGAVSWAVYLGVFGLTANIFVPSFAAAVASTFYSELLARFCRTPATVFLSPCLIPLVPGSSLYYTMSNLLTQKYAESAQYAINTAAAVLGISGGVVAASVVVYAIKSICHSRKEQTRC